MELGQKETKRGEKIHKILLCTENMEKNPSGLWQHKMAIGRLYREFGSELKRNYETEDIINTF